MPLELNSSSDADRADAERGDRMVVSGDAEQGARRGRRHIRVVELADRSTGRGCIRKEPGRQPGKVHSIGPRLGGVLPDQAGARCERRFANQVATEAVHDPLGNAEPGRTSCNGIRRRQPQHLRDARLERPGQSGHPREGRHELGIPVGNGVQLGLPAPVEPGNRRHARSTRRIQDHAALGQAGDRHGTHRDRAPCRFGELNRAADEVGSSREQVGRVDLRTAIFGVVPRRVQLSNEGHRAVHRPDQHFGRGGADVQAR